MPAHYLKLDHPETYTGHFVRRTATCMTTEGGLTTQQIKCITGHKCDATVQEYIDNTDSMRLIGSRALQLEGTLQEPAHKKPRVEVPCQEATSTYNITINLGEGNINAPISLFGRDHK